MELVQLTRGDMGTTAASREPAAPTVAPFRRQIPDQFG